MHGYFNIAKPVNTVFYINRSENKKLLMIISVDIRNGGI